MPMTELAVAAAPQPVAPPPVAPAEVAPQTTETQAEQAPAPETPAEAKPETTDEQPEKRSQSRFERRLNKVYRRYGEEKARADFLEKQLNELKAPKAPETPGEPRLEQFDDIEKYAKAKAEFAREQALKEREAKERTESLKAEQTRIQTSWEEQLTKAEEKYDDFDEVVGNIQPVDAVSVAIMLAENGADVAYYLGKNLKEAQRIMELRNPVAQSVAIGKLAAKLESQPPVPKQPSKAPAPIVPVSGNAAAPSDEISPDDDMRTFIRKRERQLGRRK